MSKSTGAHLRTMLKRCAWSLPFLLHVLSGVEARGSVAMQTAQRPARPPIGIQGALTVDGHVPLRGAVSDEIEGVLLTELALIARGVDLPIPDRLVAGLHLVAIAGGAPARSIGDLQGLSNIEGGNQLRVYEAWLEYNPDPDRLSLLAGLYDINSEFDQLSAARILINSSFGFGADYALSGNGGVSTYPYTDLAARIRTRPGGPLYLTAAVSGTSAAPGTEDRGPLLSAEVGKRVLARPTAGPMEQSPTLRRLGRARRRTPVTEELAAGGWLYARETTSLDAGARGTNARSWGVYLLAGRRLLHEAATGRTLSIFARVGGASEAANRVAAYLGGGLSAVGPLRWRPRDELAMGVAHARNGDPYLRSQAAPAARAETVVETTYSLELSGAVALQSDLQWIHHPATDPSRESVVVFTFRASVSHSSGN